MENKKNIVIVPFDFTEIAECAVEHASNMAQKQGWEVLLLHIINKDTRALLNVYKVTDDLVNARLKEKAEQIEAQYKIVCHVDAREGSIFTDIAKAAEEHKASFIVMGTHGKQGIQHIIGSYAHKVITSTGIPFIVVQKRDTVKTFNKICLPLDDTLESRQKVKWAIYIAKVFNAKVYIKAMYQSDEIYKIKIKTILAKVEQIFKQNNVNFETEYKEDQGGFSKQVINYSKAIDADLILIMTNPDSSPIPNFILNPGDEQIIFNEALIPIMAINPKDINITVVGM